MVLQWGIPRGGTGAIGEPKGFILETISCTEDRVIGSKRSRTAKQGAETEVLFGAVI